MADPRVRIGLCVLASVLILATLFRRYGPKFSAIMPNFRSGPPMKIIPSPNDPAKSAEPLPPIDLTAGDFGDASKINRDHPLLLDGRAADLNPLMNAPMSGPRAAQEFSNIRERLNALEQRK